MSEFDPFLPVANGSFRVFRPAGPESEPVIAGRPI
jgi:hypothetical protein